MLLTGSKEFAYETSTPLDTLLRKTHTTNVSYGGVQSINQLVKSLSKTKTCDSKRLSVAAESCPISRAKNQFSVGRSLVKQMRHNEIVAQAANPQDMKNPLCSQLQTVSDVVDFLFSKKTGSESGANITDRLISTYFDQLSTRKIPVAILLTEKNEAVCNQNELTTSIGVDANYRDAWSASENPVQVIQNPVDIKKKQIDCSDKKIAKQTEQLLHSVFGDELLQDLMNQKLTKTISLIQQKLTIDADMSETQATSLLPSKCAELIQFLLQNLYGIRNAAGNENDAVSILPDLSDHCSLSPFQVFLYMTDLLNIYQNKYSTDLSLIGVGEYIHLHHGTQFHSDSTSLKNIGQSIAPSGTHLPHSIFARFKPELESMLKILENQQNPKTETESNVFSICVPLKEDSTNEKCSGYEIDCSQNFRASLPAYYPGSQLESVSPYFAQSKIAQNMEEASTSSTRLTGNFGELSENFLRIKELTVVRGMKKFFMAKTMHSRDSFWMKIPFRCDNLMSLLNTWETHFAIERNLNVEKIQKTFPHLQFSSAADMSLSKSINPNHIFQFDIIHCSLLSSETFENTKLPSYEKFSISDSIPRFIDQDFTDPENEQILFQEEIIEPLLFETPATCSQKLRNDKSELLKQAVMNASRMKTLSQLKTTPATDRASFFDSQGQKCPPSPIGNQNSVFTSPTSPNFRLTQSSKTKRSLFFDSKKDFNQTSDGSSWVTTASQCESNSDSFFDNISTPQIPRCEKIYICEESKYKLFELNPLDFVSFDNFEKSLDDRISILLHEDETVGGFLKNQKVTKTKKRRVETQHLVAERSLPNLGMYRICFIRIFFTPCYSFSCYRYIHSLMKIPEVKS